MIGVSHETHKLAREKIIIMIGVLLEEKSLTRKQRSATRFLWYIWPSRILWL